MNIKQLIKDVRKLHKCIINNQRPTDYKLLAMQIGEKEGIRKAIEIIDNHCFTCFRDYMTEDFFNDYIQLKRVLKIEATADNTDFKTASPKLKHS